MTAQVPQRVFMFIASKGERPIGSCTLFIGNDVAGIHYVAVLREERGKGVGSALIAHAFRFAHEAGESHAVLLSSGMGETMYRRSNFQEVCRVGYWYAAKPR